jgi:hypothetical protein
MRTLNSLSSFALIAVAGFFCAGRSASAALYGNFVGPNVTYQNVSESDNQVISPPPVNSTPSSLFGLPALIPTGSDDLTFPNISFSALAADGSFEFQDGKLTFNVVPTNNNDFIHSLSFDEGGAYHIQGDTNNASDQALLAFNDVRITSVDGVALGTPIVVSAAAVASYTPISGVPLATISTGPTGATISLATASAAANDTGTWDINAAFNFDAALAANGLGGHQVTGISVALNDQLTASTNVQTSGHTLASIDKKHFIVTPVTTTVPEPASLALLIGGSFLLARRKTSGAKQ